MLRPVNDGYPQPSLYIGGQWLGPEGRATQAVLNPATGETLAELPLASKADLDRALDAAARGFATWRHSTAEERAKVLHGAARLLRERVESIARNATLEEGKTLPETRMETLVAAGLFEFYAEEARRIYGRVLVRPRGRRSLVVKSPVGPVAAFAPWNFPVGNPVRKLGAAVAAGCSCILKPAEEAPASGMAVVQALVDSGLPEGVVSLVFGIPDQVSTHLLASPVIRKVSFTGSVAVGKHLMRLAAANMQRTTMELGGHAPVLVFDDADLERTLGMMVTGKYRNAGQVCVSPTRFYVQRSRYQEFVDQFSARAAALKVGNGLEEGVNMGPMANARRPEGIAAMIRDALDCGATLNTGGKRIGKQGFFFAPTVLSGIPERARIMNEEPFGPVALINPFDDYDEAITLANRLPYGLAAFAFTGSADTALRLGEDIEAGMLGINTNLIAGPDAPFGGVKESGHGSEDGPEGLEACLVTRTIHQG
jgi:succinate-semialdehyde dehydrogenase/glutarate-semialdehyde dehydrogenase